MRWGVATQNGVSVSLASIVSLSCGATEFSPASLFTSGVAGAWYDPSDYSTLFQDSVGITPVTAVEQPVGLMLDKSGNNKHALQATSASRPSLRARYNLLTYSQNQENAAWTKSPPVFGAITLSESPPSGFDGFSFSMSVSDDIAQVSQSITLTAGTHTVSFYSKQTDNGGVPGSVTVTLGSGSYNVPNDLTNTWVRRSFTFTATAGTHTFAVTVTGLSAQGSFYGLQVVTGSSAGTYQRIAAATDYATAGFLPYLALSTDDSFGTNSIDFTATDKMSVCAGITKLSDAAQAILYELSVDTFLNNGSFLLWAPGSVAGANYYARVRGSLLSNAVTGASYAAPITNVATMLADIAGDSVNIRVNGASAVTSTSDLGTGNFGNYPLFIGRRNNTSLPFNGRIYQLVVCGKTLSASELASTEAYVNTKTGAY